MNLDEFVKNFEEQFDETDPGVISASTNFRELEEWSSLIALSVIAMVDECYDLKLSGEDIRTSETVEYLFKKVAAK